MSDSAQLVRNADSEEQMMETEKTGLRGLPLQSSPYLRYTDLEEYKFKTNGHISPKAGQGEGATGTPTKSGNNHLAGEGANHPDSRTACAFRGNIP